jgi:hypothetical protein
MKRIAFFFVIFLFLTSCASAPKEVICPNDLNPVCGVNQQTYTNQCIATKAGVITAHYGECVVVQVCDNTEYDPVCGENNTTYNNACDAQKANVAIAYPLNCDVEKIQLAFYQNTSTQSTTNLNLDTNNVLELQNYKTTPITITLPEFNIEIMVQPSESKIIHIRPEKVASYNVKVDGKSEMSFVAGR